MKRGRIQKEIVKSGEPAVEEQRAAKRCRRADAHLNFVTNKEIPKQHGQWRETEMQFVRNTSSNMWGGAINVVSAAKAADDCNRILRQGLPPGEESVYAKDVLTAKTRELDVWTQFKVCSPLEPGKCTGEVAGARWVLTWKMVEGVKTVRARLAE